MTPSSEGQTCEGRVLVRCSLFATQGESSLQQPLEGTLIIVRLLGFECRVAAWFGRGTFCGAAAIVLGVLLGLWGDLVRAGNGLLGTEYPVSLVEGLKEEIEIIFWRWWEGVPLDLEWSVEGCPGFECLHDSHDYIMWPTNTTSFKSQISNIKQ